MITKETIIKCKKGDRAAQELIYDHYSGKLSGICYRYCRTRFEIEDIFQDSFIKIFKYIKDYNEENSFDAWVTRIVVNTAIDNYKKNLRISYEAYPEETEQLSSNDLDVLDELSADEILNLIQLLPDGYRIVFNMFAIEGYSHKEIAEKLEISEQTSRSQYFKARRHITKLLENVNAFEANARK